MLIIEFLRIFEILFFNLLTFDLCCQRKYSVFRTVFVISAYTICLIFLCYYSIGSLNFYESNYLLFSSIGFSYLIPLNFLYREKGGRIFVILCMCWVYTNGVFTFAVQTVHALNPDNTKLYIFIIETIAFLVTMLPFYHFIVPKFIFILDNAQNHGKHWYHYLVLNGCLGFLIVSQVNTIFTEGEGSLLKVSFVVLLLLFNCMSYVMLYKIVHDSIKLKQLEYTTLHDPLTGLGNRTQLLNHMQSLLDKHQTFSILFMDLDRFKQINDQHGHVIGDEYLKHFAQICSKIFPEQGKVYRFGGDEFVVLYSGVIPQAKIDELKECKEWNINAPCPFNGVSTGVLFCEPPHKEAEQILYQVDQMMYANKSQKTGESDSSLVQSSQALL